MFFRIERYREAQKHPPNGWFSGCTFRRVVTSVGFLASDGESPLAHSRILLILVFDRAEHSFLDWIDRLFHARAGRALGLSHSSRLNHSEKVPRSGDRGGKKPDFGIVSRE